jgi:hypothetical protein
MAFLIGSRIALQILGTDFKEEQPAGFDPEDILF